ncbi:MAG TPA: long-chain fatty acid--CoA ligase [Ramlibacter sp.]|nr:long-chain fatty acid--CoA ligase [Ramlibacter sp.]
MHDRVDLDTAQELTLPQMLRWRARHEPAATALRRKSLGIWQGISWRDYDQSAREAAMGLHKLGLRRGDRIAIAAEGVPEWFFADLGAEMLGMEVVGIYPTNPWNELQHIVRHCNAKVVVCGDQEQADKVLEAMRHGDGLPELLYLICIDTKGMRHYDRAVVRAFDDLLAEGREALQAPGAADWLDREIAAARVDDVNVLIYTSGTTGPPKGAMLSHRNLTFATCQFARATGLQPGQYQAVCYLPLCHVAERSYSMVLHLVLGGVVNFAESIDTVASNIREIAPTFFLGVPRIWEKLQQNILFRVREAGNLWRALFELALRRGRKLAERRQARGGRRSLPERVEYGLWHLLLLGNIQRIMGLDRSLVRICGGASVSPETLLFFEILGLQVCQGYGLTESTGMAFVQRPRGASRVGSCGHALEGVEMRLAEDGEVLLRSPGVFQGYLHDPTATAAGFDGERWLRTGDIGKLDEAGELMIVDRKKAIIITSGGKNIAPSEIENALRDSPFVREAIVVGEGRKYLGGLIQIDYDTVGRWASERDIPYSGYKSLAVHPEVTRLVGGIVEEVNKRFARVENVRRFVILDKELDHDDGELTATQKIRRSVIERKFARELALIYDGRN